MKEIKITMSEEEYTYTLIQGLKRLKENEVLAQLERYAVIDLLPEKVSKSNYIDSTDTPKQPQIKTDCAYYVFVRNKYRLELKSKFTGSNSFNRAMFFTEEYRNLQNDLNEGHGEVAFVMSSNDKYDCIENFVKSLETMKLEMFILIYVSEYDEIKKSMGNYIKDWLLQPTKNGKCYIRKEFI